MNECWLCEAPLFDADELQYCTSCELNMAKEMLAAAEATAE